MLVGRGSELSELTQALARAKSASGSLVLLAGEPGIGKTSLAVETARLAREQGVMPVWGRCWEAGGAPALWPWREAFEAAGIEFPDTSAIASSDPAMARFALFRAVVGALGRAAAKSPMLVVFEDLHAADVSTLLLLELVAKQVSELPIVIVATYRDLEASLREDAAGSLARIGRAGRVIALSRLVADDVARLVRDVLPDADERLVATVFETTAGNPLFACEIVRDVRAHGQRSGVPLGVREVIRQRIGGLSVETRRVLDAAAVLGVEHAASDLARLAGTDAGPAIEDAVRNGVLVPRNARLRFSHALYREALYFDLPIERRRELHRDAARALAASGASLAELAHHLLESGPALAGEAIATAVRAAANAVDTFAFEDAVAILERARAAIPSGEGEDALRCRVLVAQGETKLRSGDPAGRAMCVDAAEIARKLHAPELLADAALAYGSVFLMGGVDPILVGMLEQVHSELPATDSPLRARVMARLAAARQPSPPIDRPRDIALGLAAIDMARRVANPRELLGVYQSASGVLYGAADPAVRLPISRDMERLAEELGDVARLLQARSRLALDHLEQADFAAYASNAAKYEELAGRIGPAAAPWRVPLMRSMIAIARDDFAESERQQAEARRMMADDDTRARRAEAFHRICFYRAAERHADLRAAISELRGLWLAMPYGGTLADAHVASPLAHVGADDELAALLAELSDQAIDEGINAAVMGDAVWATADRALAERVEPGLVAFADRWNIYWFDCEHAYAPNARSRAYTSAVLDRWDECERFFARAVTAAESVGRRSLVARMYFELGDLMLRKNREPERARELVAKGRESALALGLTELVALIDRRHAGPTSQRSPSRRAFTMSLEGEYFTVPGTNGTVRFKASRGMHYLAQLVERPNADIHVLDLVGSSEGADRGDAGEVIDTNAAGAYRARLIALRDAVETAEELGDAPRAAKAREEMEAIARELGRSTGKGGRVRRAESAVDRARSAVQRRIKDALDRISERDEALGAWLRRAVHTGNHCSFRPPP